MKKQIKGGNKFIEDERTSKLVAAEHNMKIKKKKWDADKGCKKRKNGKLSKTNIVFLIIEILHPKSRIEDREFFFWSW